MTWRLLSVKARVLSFELDLVGDDVALGASVDGADGNDRGVAGVFFAADDGLKLGDEESGEDNGVASDAGHGAVPADAVDDDVDGGGAGQGRTAGKGDGACGVDVGVVEADDHIGLAEALIEVVGEHGFGSVDGLLGGLANDHEGAVPLGFGLGEGAGGADEDGSVDVVPVGVHYADLLA